MTIRQKCGISKLIIELLILNFYIMNLSKKMQIDEYKEKLIKRYGSEKSPSFKRLFNIYKKLVEVSDLDVEILLDRARKIKFLAHTTGEYDRNNKIFFTKFLFDEKEIIESMSEEASLVNLDILTEIINFRKNESCVRTYALPEINSLDELKTMRVYGKGIVNGVLVPALRVHEVLAQLPERIVNKVRAFEVIEVSYKQDASRVPDNYFAFTVRLYTGSLPEDLDFPVYLNGDVY